MKNIFRILMAVAVLFTASCAKEDISSSIGGGEANVTFTVDLPELGTRAETYGKGASATTLRYYVYDGETLLEDLSTELPNEKVTLNGGKATVTLPLLKGMTYNIVFWADNGSNIYSYTPETKSITVDYTNAIANDDSRDAFYKYVPAIDPATATNEDTTIVLTRPFAQLNAATSDLAIVEDNEVILTTSTVKVNTYTQFDLVNGIVLGEPVEVVIFEAKPMPCTTGETLPNKPSYTYLSMNYLLPGTVDAVFTFKGKRLSDNSEVTFTGTTYTNVPLKSNYRTNILGALLTKPTDFTVTIDAVFSQPDDNRDDEGKAYLPGTTIMLEKAAKAQDGGVVYLNSADDFKYLRTLTADWSTITGSVGYDHYYYKTAWKVVLAKNLIIDLQGANWTPFSIDFASIDGNGSTISNFIVDVTDTAGLFTVAPSISNLNIKNATIKGSAAGAIAGKPRGSIKNCSVIDSHISGKYAGGLGGNGNANYINNRVANTTIISNYKDAGGLCGFNERPNNIQNNVIESDVVIKIENSTQTDRNIGALIGRWNYPQTYEGNTTTPGVPVVSGNTNNTAYALIGAVANGTMPVQQ